MTKCGVGKKEKQEELHGGKTMRVMKVGWISLSKLGNDIGLGNSATSCFGFRKSFCVFEKWRQEV
jgi:hypothetical protein